VAVKKRTHWGSTLDDFLKEEGIYDEAKTQVAKEMIAWQIQQAMKRKADQEADGRADNRCKPIGGLVAI
jgi:hypothetical protein